jgi:hypothetical protein
MVILPYRFHADKLRCPSRIAKPGRFMSDRSARLAVKAAEKRKSSAEMLVQRPTCRVGKEIHRQT